MIRKSSLIIMLSFTLSNIFFVYKSSVLLTRAREMNERSQILLDKADRIRHTRCQGTEMEAKKKEPELEVSTDCRSNKYVHLVTTHGSFKTPEIVSLPTAKEKG